MQQEPVNLQAIVDLLKIRKAAYGHTVLFLGARAGGLYRNPVLYQQVAQFSSRSFELLSNSEKFAECFRVLKEKFTPADAFDFLNVALQSQEVSEAHESLAELVREDFFDVVISTNIDSLVEDAFRAYMKEGRDFQVYLPQKDALVDIEQHKPRYCTLIHLFGTLVSRHFHSPPDEFNPDRDAHLKNYLVTLLKRHVLVLGYDPLWDRPLEALFPLSENSLWYVNEEAPPPGSFVSYVLQRRQERALLGPQGAFDAFLPMLRAQLLAQKSRPESVFQNGQDTSADLHTGPEVSPPTLEPAEDSSSASLNGRAQKGPKKVFISYSHKDAAFLARFQTFLAPYKRNGALEVWDDKQIEFSDLWLEKIEQALADTEIAVLLVSADFFASEFIAEKELPVLLDAARKGAIKLIPVVLRPCSFKDSPLEPFQGIVKPLSSMTEYEQEDTWVKLVEYIRDA